MHIIIMYKIVLGIGSSSATGQLDIVSWLRRSNRTTETRENLKSGRSWFPIAQRLSRARSILTFGPRFMLLTKTWIWYLIALVVPFHYLVLLLAAFPPRVVATGRDNKLSTHQVASSTITNIILNIFASCFESEKICYSTHSIRFKHDILFQTWLQTWYHVLNPRLKKSQFWYYHTFDILFFFCNTTTTNDDDETLHQWKGPTTN